MKGEEKSVVLYYNDLATGGSSDKEYRIQIVKAGDGYNVLFQYGRRGGTLSDGTKTKEPVPLEEAERIYQGLIREKLGKGYIAPTASELQSGSASVAPKPLPKDVSRTPYVNEELVEIDEEMGEVHLLKDSRYVMQIKLDGHFRDAEKRADGSIISYNKLGEAKPFPPAVEQALAKIPLDTFFLRGELIGDLYIPVDMLFKNGVDLAGETYEKRFVELGLATDGTDIKPVQTWWTEKDKRAGIALCRKRRTEGVCFKLKSAKYQGKRSLHMKLKFLKSATCKILALAVKGHDNARLGLFDGKKWIEVCGASMIGKDKRIIKVGSLVEVSFLYATEGNRLYQPRIKELREDVAESDVTLARQLPKSSYKGATS
jgi:bifunctional non-homologous end joining protein LigD